jgi:PKD repeat protein
MKILKKFCLPMFILFLIFPIKLDAQVEIVVKPGPNDGKDAYINTYNNYSNGSHQSFIAAAWTYEGTFGVRRSFIQFPLPELPESYTNFKAFLNFYYDYSSPHVGHGGDNESKLERITSAWTDYDIDWDNQPTVSTENAVILPTSETSYQDYPDIDVTQLLLDMYEYPLNSFGFRLSLVEEDIYRSMIFASSNHPDEIIRPSLVIRYDTCVGPSNSFTYQSDNLHCQFYYNDSSVTSWSWDFGNGFNSELQNPDFNYEVAGSYLVCLTVQNNCDSVKACDSIKVCTEPDPGFSFVIDSLNVRFTNLSSNCLEYYWDFGNGYFSTQENPVFQFDEPGEYIVCLSVENECNSSAVCDTVLITSSSGINFTNSNSAVWLYPNPGHKEIFLGSDNVKIYQIEFYNSIGLVTYCIRPENFQNNYRISLQDKVPGLYLVRFNTDHGTIIKRLIIL